MPSSLRRQRRLAAAGAALVVLVLAGLVALLTSGSQPPRQRPQTAHKHISPAPGNLLFARTSIWNAPLRAGAPVDPSSGRLISALDQDVVSELHSGVGPWIATGKASTPIYVVGSHRHSVRVQLDDPTPWWRVALQRAFEAVPIPDGAQPARGPDAQMTVWQPSTDRLWEFFRMRKEMDGWHAAWGGAIDHVSTSPGYYTRASWPGALPQWGATATSLPVAAGVITIQQFRAGVIDHALAINLPAPRAGVVAFPAERSDGTGGPGTLPEGAELRIDPHFNLNSVSMPPVTRMIAVAAQRYGMIVRDQTHLGTSMFGEDPAQFGGKQIYYGPHGIFGGRTPLQLLAKFPWSHLQVLKLHLTAVRPAVKAF
jgi:hypothetical protein